MLTDIISADSTIDLKAIEDELRPQSTEKLKFRFFECYGGAARFIAEAAICVKLLKERGDSMTGVPMAGTFLRIASGQILPELVWKFIESPNRQIVERLPLDDQKRLAADSMLEVVEPTQGGSFTKRKVDMLHAPKEIARVVVGPDGIRSIEEQLAAIGPQRTAKALATHVPAKADVAEEPLVHQISVKLSESELEEIRTRAAKARVPERIMVRRLILKSLKSWKANPGVQI